MHEQAHHQQRQRHAELDGELQRQVVRVVEEGGGAAGERRQGPREIEFAETDTEPRLLRDQRQRVGPDAEARAGDIALRQPRLAAEGMVALMRPQRKHHPAERIDHRHRQQQHAHEAGEAAAQRMALEPASAREPPTLARRHQHVETTPGSHQRHAHQAGARCAEHHREHQQRHQHGGQGAMKAPRLHQRHDGHAGPQQRAAQMVGLAHIAHRAPGQAGAGDPVAVGPVRRKHLRQGDQRARHTGEQPAPAEGGEQGLALRHRARLRAGDEQHRRSEQHAGARQ